MKLLLAVDSITTLNILLDEVVVRSWPDGTKAQVLSVVEDGEVPVEIWPELHSAQSASAITDWWGL